MMIQWPDKFYHTSEDTIEKLDPKMLKRVATVAATYTCFMANAGYEESLWLASEMAGRSFQDIAEICLTTVARVMDKSRETYSCRALRDACDFYLSRRNVDLRELERLVPPENRSALRSRTGQILDSLRAYMKDRVESTVQLLKTLRGGESDEPTGFPFSAAPLALIEETQSLIPVRLYRGPIDLSMLNERFRDLSIEERAAYRAIERRRQGKKPTAKLLFMQIVYWMDGLRSVHEIARNVGLETGVFDLELVASYVKVLVRMRFVKWRF
jgi:hypothetical protein